MCPFISLRLCQAAANVNRVLGVNDRDQAQTTVNVKRVEFTGPISSRPFPKFQ